MAYFSNSTEGMFFDEQCDKCRGYNKPCPISSVQILYNYDAVNNPLATSILNMLVLDNGTCNMFKMFQKELELTEDEKNQLELFKGE